MTKKKERTIESFSKDVLVVYIKQWDFGGNLHRLRSIELDIEYKKLDAKVKANIEATTKALKEKNFAKYYELMAESERLQKRINKLLEI